MKFHPARIRLQGIPQGVHVAAAEGGLARFGSRCVRVACVLLMLACGAACDRVPLHINDLDEAKAAISQRDWPRAERVLERYLRTAENPQQRWEAWMLLVDVYSRINLDLNSALGQLEAMLQEFAQDAGKQKLILARLGELHENLGHISQAVAVWGRYAELGNLTDQEAASVQRALGHLHFRQRRFDLAEEALQTCQALPVEESFRAWCLYDLALANMARDELDDARDQAIQVLSMKVDDQLRGLSGFLLADVLEQQGLRAEALSRFESVRSLYPNEMVVDNRIAHLKKKLQSSSGSSKP
ncbi:MAG: tetratricopeptide repeat protein [Desulfovibrionaceae bacterium]|nr:tetratricopeptide repeat protein [Desulfovibrionaceae bacterium]